MERWTKEDLVKHSQQSVDVEVLGKLVKIGKLKAKDIQPGNGTEHENSIKLLCASLVEPVLKSDEMLNMGAEFMTGLMEKVMEFNGLDLSDKELEKN
jgi:hypothetical protein